MSRDTHAIQTPSKPADATPDDLELKSVGNAKLVVVYHRDAYGVPAVSLQANAA